MLNFLLRSELIDVYSSFRRHQRTCSEKNELTKNIRNRLGSHAMHESSYSFIRRNFGTVFNNSVQNTVKNLTRRHQ